MLPGNVLPAFSILLTHFHGLSESQYGYLVSVNVLAGVVASATGPMWIARVDLRRLVAACLIGDALALIALGYAPSMWALTVAQLLGGATASAIGSVSFVLLGQTDNPARAIGLRVTSDVVMGGVFLAALPGDALGLRGYVAVLGLVTVLGIVIAARLPQRTRPPLRLAERARSTSSAAWLALVAVVIFNIGAVGDWIFIGFFAEHAGLPAGPVANVIAASLLAGVIGSLSAAHMAGRSAALWAQLVAAGVFLLSIPWLAATSSLTEFGAAGFAYNAAWNFIGPFLVALVAVRDQSGRLSSLVPAAVGLGTLISPTLTGTLIEQRGVATATARVGGDRCGFAGDVFRARAARSNRGHRERVRCLADWLRGD